MWEFLIKYYPYEFSVMATLVYALDLYIILLIVCSWTSSMGIIYQFSSAAYAFIMLQSGFSLLFAIEPLFCNSNLLTICYLFQHKTIDSTLLINVFWTTCEFWNNVGSFY